jgi:hypothetical protein
LLAGLFQITSVDGTKVTVWIPHWNEHRRSSVPIAIEANTGFVSNVDRDSALLDVTLAWRSHQGHSLTKAALGSLAGLWHQS